MYKRTADKFSLSILYIIELHYDNTHVIFVLKSYESIKP